MNSVNRRAGGAGRFDVPASSRERRRGLLLDAACAQLLEHPWDRVSMNEVAQRAGIHRSSLYNEFGSRRNLLRALIAREAELLPESFAAVLCASAHSPPRALEELFTRFLQASRQNGVLAALLRGGEEEIRALAATRRGRVLEHLAAALGEAWPQLDRRHREQVAQWLFALALSIARMPARPHTADAVGALLGSYVCRQIGRGDAVARASADSAPLLGEHHARAAHATQRPRPSESTVHQPAPAALHASAS